MKKILISLSIIGAVAAIAISATTAYFSDTETSSGNTFTAGTIDIAVNGQNPWEIQEPFVFADMKPSQVEYSNFTINNVGTNPVNVWKKVDVGTTSGGVAHGTASSEPECLEQSGTWANGQCTGGQENSAIDTAITYDLSVVVKQGGVEKWNQTLYNMNKTIFQITGQGTFLGMIPAGWTMDVTESYHMLASTTNWAQGDVMPFGITLTGEQLTGTVVLEDKDQVAPWRVRSDTDPKIIFTYGVKDSTLKIGSLTGKTVVAGNHSLITYPETFSTPAGAGYPGTGVVLATVTTDGSGNITGFTQVTTDPDTFTNMKVWLIPDSDLIAGTATFNAWNGGNYMFDTGLIDYYKS